MNNLTLLMNQLRRISISALKWLGLALPFWLAFAGCAGSASVLDVPPVQGTADKGTGFVFRINSQDEYQFRIEFLDPPKSARKSVVVRVKAYMLGARGEHQIEDYAAFIYVEPDGSLPLNPMHLSPGLYRLQISSPFLEKDMAGTAIHLKVRPRVEPPQPPPSCVLICF